MASDQAVRPTLMGILNVNADSFSDPRAATDMDAVARGLALRDAGAAIIDVGAESASPATPVVTAAAEIAALVPVVEALTAAGVVVSVDTYKPAVARACAKAGAAIINDYSGLVHPELAGLCAEHGARLVLTHNPPGVKAKVLDPGLYDDVTAEVARWFEARLTTIEAAGLPRDRVVLDPGIDLAKTPAQSIALLRDVAALTSFGLPLLVAISRKDFIGAVSPSRPADRDPGTLAALGHLIGVPGAIARVHDVAACTQYLDVHGVLAGDDPVDPELAVPLELRRQSA
jgi:dihydropteroate synthase